MKPWEQEWQTNESEGRTVETRGWGFAVAEAYPASADGGVAEQFEVATFISAAPDMARALLAQGYEVRGEWHTAICDEVGHDDSCEQARVALRKAGVLP